MMEWDWRDWLKTQKVYASRGYTSLVGWIVTIGTFALVSYNELMEIFPPLLIIFPNAFVFMFISLPIVIGILTRLGKWDWKRGTFPTEGVTAFQNNPEWVDHRKEVVTKEYVDEKFDEIKELIKEREQ